MTSSPACLEAFATIRVDNHARRLLLDMIYYVLVQPEGSHMLSFNVIIVRGWRMASFLIEQSGALDILQHTPWTYSKGTGRLAGFY
jgi:hypothetical protein